MNLQGDDIRVEMLPVMPPIQMDENNNALLSPLTEPLLFDALSVYATVKVVKAMYERALGKEIVSRWGKTPALTIILDDSEEPNAFYGPMRKSLIFCHFKDITSGQTVYTRQMYDVVTHECGHYILDCLKPQYLIVDHLETLAFHEAFGDFTTLLALLDNLTFCNHVVLATKGNLHKASFFSNFAEQFGSAHLRKPNGLRNADDDVKIQEITQESHDMSRVLVGIIYDILSNYYDAMKQDKLSKQSGLYLSGDQLGSLLFKVGESMKSLIAQAVVKSSDTKITFKEFLQNMLDIETDIKYKTIIFNASKAKGIDLLLNNVSLDIVMSQ